MGTYDNDYTKEEDEILWELHEIRHQVGKTLAEMGINKFNVEAKKILEDRKKLIEAIVVGK